MKHNTFSALFQHVSHTSIPAFIAAVISGLCIVLDLPVWAMFVGWVAFFTRVSSPTLNLISVYLGIQLGIVSALFLALLTPVLESFSLPLVVFVVAMIVISMRSMPHLNNLLCYFLGLIAFFASHLSPSIESFGILSFSVTLGLLAGVFSTYLQKKIAHNE